MLTTLDLPDALLRQIIAALAIRADLQFVTLDADFRRFEAVGLRLHLLGA